MNSHYYHRRSGDIGEEGYLEVGDRWKDNLQSYCLRSRVTTAGGGVGGLEGGNSSDIDILESLERAEKCEDTETGL